MSKTDRLPFEYGYNTQSYIAGILIILVNAKLNHILLNYEK